MFAMRWKNGGFSDFFFNYLTGHVTVSDVFCFLIRDCFIVHDHSGHYGRPDIVCSFSNYEIVFYFY